MSVDPFYKAGNFYRRHLPHWQPPSSIIFVTYRIAGSLPTGFTEALIDEKENLTKQALLHGKTKDEAYEWIHKILFQRIDQAFVETLESDYSSKMPQWLSNPRITKVVSDAFHYWDGKRYKLHRYVIMPNHVHILIEPLEIFKDSDIKREQVDNGIRFWQLSKIMQGLKGYSARQANEILGRKGQFWHDESFDHWIRNQGELDETYEYIDLNPVKAGLCKKPEDWKWSSAGEK